MNGYPLISSTVKQLESINLTGNVIPPAWYKNITFENKKADLLAISILAELVYWFRPIQERDESTGEPLPPRQKFAKDKLYRTYKSLAGLFGVTDRMARDACHRLKDQGLITIEYRNITFEDRIIPSLTFFDLNFQAILQISQVIENKEHHLPASHSNLPHPTLGCTHVLHPNVATNTSRCRQSEISSESTTEITTEIPPDLNTLQAEDGCKVSRPVSVAQVINASSREEEEPVKEVELIPPTKEQDFPKGTPFVERTIDVLGAFATLRRLNMKVFRGGWARLTKEHKLFIDNKITVAEVEKFTRYWYSQDFRGEEDRPPTLDQISQMWDTAMGWREPGQEEPQVVTAVTLINRPSEPKRSKYETKSERNVRLYREAAEEFAELDRLIEIAEAQEAKGNSVALKDRPRLRSAN